MDAPVCHDSRMTAQEGGRVGVLHHGRGDQLVLSITVGPLDLGAQFELRKQLQSWTLVTPLAKHLDKRVDDVRFLLVISDTRGRDDGEEAERDKFHDSSHRSFKTSGTTNRVVRFGRKTIE